MTTSAAHDTGPKHFSGPPDDEAYALPVQPQLFPLEGDSVHQAFAVPQSLDGLLGALDDPDRFVGDGVDLQLNAERTDGSPELEEAVIPVTDVVRFLLDSDADLAKRLEELRAARPDVTSAQSCKVGWAANVGRIVGGRDNIRNAVQKLKSRLPADMQQEIDKQYGGDDERG